MSHSNSAAAQCLVSNLALIKGLGHDPEVLDLACGNGRNGLFLARHNVFVIFADSNEVAIQSISEKLRGNGLKGECWRVDFEEAGSQPLQGRLFDAVMVFNYLHRPLLNSIKQAIRPGGLIIYETFTVKQREFGRPGNPDFLLQPAELRKAFGDWEILQDFEGEMTSPRRAVASLIARRPGLT
ncbi:MAG: class I SAM-dependent methyltransferase [Pseudohongiella sp.]|jgi:tellurite methyltransferase|nr:class I SAM-dependent methyltransferase [Pseudohongiella sp.]